MTNTPNTQPSELADNYEFPSFSSSNHSGTLPTTTLTQHFYHARRMLPATALGFPLSFPGQQLIFPTPYYAPFHYNPIMTSNSSSVPYQKPAYPPYQESVIQSTNVEDGTNEDQDGPSPTKKLLLTKKEALSPDEVGPHPPRIQAGDSYAGSSSVSEQHFTFTQVPTIVSQPKLEDTKEGSKNLAPCLAMTSSHTRQMNVVMSPSNQAPVTQPCNGSYNSESPTADNKDSLLNGESQQNVCIICADKATGNHYGVTSCEGCKGFFKRTVQNKKTYTCRNLSKDCPIDKRHRNRCQFCRYQKCLAAGMLKEAVREDRTPGGKHKNANLLKLKLPALENDPAQIQMTCWSSPQIESFLKISNLTTPVLNGDAQKTVDIKHKTVNYVIQLADWQINDVWTWFDKLPFLSEISHDDRKVLVQNSLMEILAFGLAWRSMNTANRLLLGEGVYLDAESANMAGIGEITQRILQLSSKLNELKLVEEEYVCLKIIVLLNPDVRGLEDQEHVEKLQDQVHTNMQEYITHRYPSQPNRFGNVLLRLPELRSISTKITERLFFLNVTHDFSKDTRLNDFLYALK